ncbi:hypothetical protein BFG60_0964 [Microcystis aeruginosa NIES-98]|nr:hypothetical protein BFG60_0964 [Microcystis aeruginosa NIES-98]
MQHLGFAERVCRGVCGILGIFREKVPKTSPGLLKWLALF